MQRALSLGFGLKFPDLYVRDGMIRVDQAFLTFLKEADLELFNRLMAARRKPDELTEKDHSTLLVDVAPHLDDFIAALFGITREVNALRARHETLAPLATVKRLFVQRRAVKGVSEADAAAIDGPALAVELAGYFGEPLTELVFAANVQRWLDDEAAHVAHLEIAAKYAAWATLSPAGRALHAKGVLFKVPHKLDFMNLVPVWAMAASAVFGANPSGSQLLGGAVVVGSVCFAMMPARRPAVA